MFAKSVAVFTLLAATAVSALKIETPAKLVQCADVEWNWSDGQPKYLLSIVRGDDPCGAPIMEFEETSNTKQTWKVNVPAGTPVQAVAIDSKGDEAWSGVLTVQDGDASCLAGVKSAPPPPSAPSPSAPPAPTKTPAPPKPVAPVNPAGVANVESSTNAAASSFVISSGAIAAVIGVAALLL